MSDTLFDYGDIEDLKYNPFTGVYSPTSKNEIRTVPASAPYIIKLFGSPQENSPTTTEIETVSGAVSLTEVSFNTEPGNLEFRVQYDALGNGQIEFNSAQAGVQMDITYLNLGTNIQKDTMTLNIIGTATSKVIASTNSSSSSQQIANEVISISEDASVKINNIIDELYAIGGGEIKLLEGTYNIANNIVFKPGIVFTGSGINTIIKASSNITNMLYYIGSSNDILIQNLLIDGYKSLYTVSNGISLPSATVKDVTVQNCTGNGFSSINSVINCRSLSNNLSGYTGCTKVINCESKLNTYYGFTSCTMVSNCFAYQNGSDGFKTCTEVSSSYSNENNNGFYGCDYLSSNRATSNTLDGFYDCENIVACYSRNNSQYGFNTCKGMQQNRSSGNATASYNNCIADKSGTYPIAATGTDTPNGGFNGQL